VVGVGIGAVICLVIFACTHRSPVLAATLAVAAWTWLTGSLHLDGLADLTDALAAAHRDPRKFFTVLSDPHVGAFGVVSIVLAIMLKTAGLFEISGSTLLALPLVPAWARLGPLAWGRWLKPLKPGQGERFAWQIKTASIVLWTIVLLAGSAVLAPILCIAPIVIVAWGVWLHRRLGGVTGDCLGAGVEVAEIVLVIALGWVGQAGGLGFQT
jgi:adenosylcobinamide-GDP ribazoletransferase